MKTIKSIVTITIAIAAFSSVALALPPWKEGRPSPAMTKGDFETLKAGDKIALVCKASDTVTIIDIKDKAAAMQLCKEGRMVACPECKKEYKTTILNPTGKGPGPQTQVAMVNEKGKPCMFFAKVR